MPDDAAVKTRPAGMRRRRRTNEDDVTVELHWLPRLNEIILLGNHYMGLTTHGKIGGLQVVSIFKVIVKGVIV